MPFLSVFESQKFTLEDVPINENEENVIHSSVRKNPEDKSLRACYTSSC